MKGHPQGQSKCGVSAAVPHGVCVTESEQGSLRACPCRPGARGRRLPPTLRRPPVSLQAASCTGAPVGPAIVSAANSWPQPGSPCSERYPIIPLAQRVLPSCRAISSRLLLPRSLRGPVCGLCRSFPAWPRAGSAPSHTASGSPRAGRGTLQVEGSWPPYFQSREPVRPHKASGPRSQVHGRALPYRTWLPRCTRRSLCSTLGWTGNRSH